MFEIHDDDDDGFWEKLPLDEDGIMGQIKLSNSVSNKDDIGFPSGSTNLTSDLPNEKMPSTKFSSMTSEPRITTVMNCNSTSLAHRSQLAPIHNVLSSCSVLDRNQMRTSSTSLHQDNLLGFKPSVSEKDPLQSPVSSKFVTSIPKTSSYSCSRSSIKPGSKRKFPGPAGILPESCPTDFSKLEPNSPVITKDPPVNEVFTSTQSSSACDPFSSSSWKSLMSDIGPDAKSVLTKFAIKAMLLKASKRVLPKGKIPLVMAFVDSVEFHGCDGTAVLRDPSGKVHGALHNDLVKDPGTAIKAGSVILLRQTSVISPTPRTHYLNITPANIVVIYSQSKDSPNVCKSPWSPTAGSSSSSPDSLPSLPQIIQDSDNELTFALNNPPTPQHATATTTTRLTPNSSQVSLFGSVANNSPPFPPHHRFPATNPNTPVNNRFKSPIANNAVTQSTRSPSFNQRHLNPPKSNHFNNATTSFQPRTPTLQYRPTSNHTSSINRSYTFHNQPSTVNGQCLPSSSHLNNQQNTSTKPSSLQSTSVSLLSRKNTEVQSDDFLDDDTDLLSLCDDSDIVCNKNITMSNQNFNVFANSIPKTDKHQSEISLTHSKTPLNNVQNSHFNSGNNPGSENIRGINSSIQNSISENVKSVNFAQIEQHEMALKDTSSSKEVRKMDNHLHGTVVGLGLNSGVIRGGDSGGGRDARVQLGASRAPQQTVTVGKAPSFGTWDDDLDDELLSQL